MVVTLKRSVACLGAGLVMLVLLTGCGGGETVKLPATVPFSGKVTLDGKPLEGAILTFIPSSPGGEVGTGSTNADGKYELKIGTTITKSGGVPGTYKVRINRLSTMDGKPFDPTKKGSVSVPGGDLLKEEYSDQEKTQLQATIPDQGGTKDFELTGK
jgi:hypothetical protein